MAASRRGPLIRDQWTEEEDRHRGRRDRHAHHHHRHPPSPEPRRRERADRYRSDPITDDTARLPEKGRRRSRSPRPYANRHELASRREDRSERERPRRRIEDERLDRREREREPRAPREVKRRKRSPEIEWKVQPSEPSRRRERSPRPTRQPSPPERPRGRDRSPLSSRRDHYSSRDHRDSHVERRIRDDDRPLARPCSRSPVPLDHYRPHASRPHSLSTPRYRSSRDEPRLSHRRDLFEGSPYDRARSPARGSRLASERGDTPEEISKSSRRSDKQKQRTLKHLRTRTKANEFLRNLSVSPPPDEPPPDDDRMQSQPGRPIQSILDEPPRHHGSRPASLPRPIPTLDDGGARSGPHVHETFPMHGIKARDNRRGGPPHIDTRQPYGASPQHATPTSSFHGSPHSASPYSQGRGGWGGQPYVPHSK